MKVAIAPDQREEVTEALEPAKSVSLAIFWSKWVLALVFVVVLVEFALATVVWRQGPSSGQPGARAVITAAGNLLGWIGGACAEPAVIREAQRAISARKLRHRVGAVLDVLVDEVAGGKMLGRSYAEAPEIDGIVHLEGARKLRPGAMVRARIERADAYDLWARPMEG